MVVMVNTGEPIDQGGIFSNDLATMLDPINQWHLDDPPRDVNYHWDRTATPFVWMSAGAGQYTP